MKWLQSLFQRERNAKESPDSSAEQERRFAVSKRITHIVKKLEKIPFDQWRVAEIPRSLHYRVAHDKLYVTHNPLGKITLEVSDWHNKPITLEYACKPSGRYKAHLTILSYRLTHNSDTGESECLEGYLTLERFIHTLDAEYNQHRKAFCNDQLSAFDRWLQGEEMTL